MAWPCEKTHRCAGSLQNEVSIRKNANKLWRTDTDGIYEGWTLWGRYYDSEYDFTENIYIATITFCPFCGEKL